MESGNENFTTKKLFPSLTFYAARMVYYLNLNTMYNIHKEFSEGWNCECNKYYGCKTEAGFMDYCNLCQLDIKHFPCDYEKDYNIKNLINKNIELVEDLKTFDIKLINDDFKSKTWSPFFYEYSFYNTVFNESLFIKYDTFHL